MKSKHVKTILITLLHICPNPIELQCLRFQGLSEVMAAAETCWPELGGVATAVANGQCRSPEVPQHMSSHAPETAELHWRCCGSWDAGAAGFRCREAALVQSPGKCRLAAVQCHTDKKGQR